MNFGKLWETVKYRGPWHAESTGHKESDRTRDSNNQKCVTKSIALSLDSYADIIVSVFENVYCI